MTIHETTSKSPRSGCKADIPALTDAAARRRTIGRGAHGRFDDRTAFIVLFVVWWLVLLTVQPWTRTDPAGAGDGSSALKGALLMLCIVCLLMMLPPRAALRVPGPTALYLLYGSYVVIFSVLQPNAVESAFRGTRLLLGLLVPVMLWPVVRGRPRLMIYACTAAYGGLALTVLAGAALSPEQAWQEGKPFQSARLVGAFLPMMAPRVGEIGAILVGLTVILWTQRKLHLVLLLAAVSVGTGLIVFSHTRTAALALVLALLAAFLTCLGSPGGRRGLVLMISASAAVLPFMPTVIAWALRGQETEQLQNLTGRTTAWDFILSQPYDPLLFWFGHGLGDKRIVLRRGQGDINVVPIDNSWLDAFWETGAIGTILVALAVLAALLYSLTTPGLAARAFAVFLMSYVMVSSVSESGLCDFSSLTLLVLVAVLVSAVDRADAREKKPHRQAPFGPARLMSSGQAPSHPGTI